MPVRNGHTLVENYIISNNEEQTSTGRPENGEWVNTEYTKNHFIFREMRHWIYIIIMVVLICFDGSMMMLTFTRIAFLLIILDFCLSRSFRPIPI